MIAYLSGTLRRKSEGQVVVETAGVGYRVFVTASTLTHLPDVGDSVALEIHTVVKEDDISLYGFMQEEECRLFQLLLGVSGVGPKSAMSVLNQCPWESVVSAIQDEDPGRLSALKGIGEKTAKLLVLGLKKKLDEIYAGKVGGASSPKIQIAGPLQALAHDAELALVSLGYSRPDVQRTLARMKIKPDTDLRNLVKDSLQMLSGGVKG